MLLRRLCRTPGATHRPYATFVERLKQTIGFNPAPAAYQPGAPAAEEALPETLTLDAYADQLRNARRLSSFASLLPKSAVAAAGGDASMFETIKRQEAVISALSAEERTQPTASLSAAARARIAQEASCTVADVGDALAKCVARGCSRWRRLLTTAPDTSGPKPPWSTWRGKSAKAKRRRRAGRSFRARLAATGSRRRRPRRRRRREDSPRKRRRSLHLWPRKRRRRHRESRR